MTHPARLEPGSLQLLANLQQAGALTDTGLHLTDPNMPIEQAAAVGRLLSTMDTCVKFAIGDWLIFTEQVYPEEWSQLVEVLGLSEDRRREYMRVAERVPRSVRREQIDWSLHRAVAALKRVDTKTGRTVTDHAAQKEWLRRVETENISHHALRNALRNGQPPPDPTVCRCCKRPL